MFYSLKEISSNYKETEKLSSKELKIHGYSCTDKKRNFSMFLTDVCHLIKIVKNSLFAPNPAENNKWNLSLHSLYYKFMVDKIYKQSFVARLIGYSF